ncbi:MAG: tRNA-dihydrouridine synthase, partial [Pseudomonadota bacterium]
KMRLGWDRGAMNAPEIARRAEAAGVQAITIHGRTRCDFYKGEADWRAIRRVVDAVTVPVIANGDIVDLASAKEALAISGAAAVMIGRGAQGAPWVPSQIAAGLSGRPAAEAPRGSALAELICRHHEAQLVHYGREIGLRTARKHLGWYLGRVAGAGSLRAALMRAETPEAVAHLLRTDLPQLGAAEEALAA